MSIPTRQLRRLLSSLAGEHWLVGTDSLFRYWRYDRRGSSQIVKTKDRYQQSNNLVFDN